MDEKDHLIGIGASLVLAAATAAADIKVGFIGSLSSDTGLSTLRGAEIAVEELNPAGGGSVGRRLLWLLPIPEKTSPKVKRLMSTWLRPRK
ncbi:MAG: hypothetical protein CM1200mP18_13560 [Gammaproteobacteria bacterium]|nr:MAG: hypothetical protein CM1200mP18_13560 [Gammaproteobacteria bacterium]